MAKKAPVIISSAVEGILDEAVAGRLIESVGAVAGPVHSKNGKAALQDKISGYNHAANISPWFVLADLDHDFACAPLLRDDWLPRISTLMCLRIAVRQVEAWLLADRQGVAKFLGVAMAHVPIDPEGLDNPKRSLVELARRSRRRAIREGMVPRHGSGRPVGPAYASFVAEFVQESWRPKQATRRSDSLRRCIDGLRRLVERCGASAG